MRRLLPLLALALAPVASAQVDLTLRPPATPIYAGQLPELQLTVRNQGKTPVTVGNVLKDGRIPCPTFKVFDRAGGAPLTSPITDCIVGDRVTLASGQKAVYKVQLPIPLQPGEYTAVMTVPTEPKVQYAQTMLRVGPGPFVAELRVPPKVKAGTPLPLKVAFRNVWRSVAEDEINLCHAGLIIRDERGRTVYDNAPEQAICPEVLDALRLSPGSIRVRNWVLPKPLPKLSPGSYTAVMWGEFNASIRFEVKK